MLRRFAQFVALLILLLLLLGPRAMAQAGLAATEWHTVLEMSFLVRPGPVTDHILPLGGTHPLARAQLYAVGTTVVVYPDPLPHGAFRTRLSRMALEGDSTYGPITVRLNPEKVSRGQVTGRRPALSLFDVFFEIQLGDAKYYNKRAIRIQSKVNHFPGVLGSYLTEEKFESPIVNAHGQVVALAVGTVLRFPVGGVNGHLTKMRGLLEFPSGEAVPFEGEGTTRVERTNPARHGSNINTELIGLELVGHVGEVPIVISTTERRKTHGRLTETSHLAEAPARGSFEAWLRIDVPDEEITVTNRMPIRLTAEVFRIPLVGAVYEFRGRVPVYRLETDSWPVAWITELELHLGDRL